MAKSYLYLKPKQMMDSVFYWIDIFHVPYQTLKTVRNLELLAFTSLCAMGLFCKRIRKEMVYMSLLYFVNIYVMAMAFAFNRYAEQLQPICLVGIGIGLGLLHHLWARRRQKKNPVLEKIQT